MVELKHFQKAILNIVKYGDNDTLPFDVDTKFIKDNQSELANIAFNFFDEHEKKIKLAIQHGKNADEIDALLKNVATNINKINIEFERLLTPSGLFGFRTTTKIHAFWNLYLNGLGVAIAERLELIRSEKVYSYRYLSDGSEELFNRESSWRYYREQTLIDPELLDSSYVVQTDISGFYEHIYHHRIENFIADIFPQKTSVGKQIDRILSKLSSGRSFGLPVGSQCSRILAELFMSHIDTALTDKSINWHRYVDDITLIAKSEAEAYSHLAELSHLLSNFGLSLNRTKTTIMPSNHYKNYVIAQLGLNRDSSWIRLSEIDLHFDPYSDTAVEDFEELRAVVENIDIHSLLNDELSKGQPDAYLVSKISQTILLQKKEDVLSLCKTFLQIENLHAFRGSWSTIMRAISKVRGNSAFQDIFDDIDELLDQIICNAKHLLLAETNSLYLLKAIRFKKTPTRGIFVTELFDKTKSFSIQRACMECWEVWKERNKLIGMRNIWGTLHSEVQRRVWLSSYKFNDDGAHLRLQLENNLLTWQLGIQQNGNSDDFMKCYLEWANQYE